MVTKLWGRKKAPWGFGRCILPGYPSIDALYVGATTMAEFGRREIYGADAMLYAARAVVAYAVALLDGAPRTVAAERFGAVLSDGATAWIHEGM